MKAMRFVKGVRSKIKRPGVMNRLEEKYAAHLEDLKKSGEIADFSYEALKIRLADKTFFTPDFMILLPTGVIEMHEVKAFWKSKSKPHVESSAAIKLKVAAETCPFRFVMVWHVKGVGWERKEF